MLTEEFKSTLNNYEYPCYVISKDNIIKYMNPAAVSFTPKGTPGADFLKTLCGRMKPCDDCPLLKEITSDRTTVSADSLCSFANVTFSLADNDDSLILSTWNQKNADPLTMIKEINLQKALDSLGGMREAYDNVLAVYYQEGAKKPQVILSHYDNRDYYNLRIEVHGLKGTSYVIGAEHLGDFAKKLEFACRDIEANEDKEKVLAAKQTIDDEINDLIVEYKDLLSKLSVIFGPYSEESGEEELPDIPTDEEACNHLRKSIELMESFELEDAQNHLELAIEKMDNEAQKNYINSVLRLLADFNYDDAAAKLKAWFN